ncbi:MAG: winged helix-turn-helix domain-containing protein [bacterium]
MSQSLLDTFSLTSRDCHLEIDYAAHTVRANGVTVSLTPTEYDVLVCLAARTSAVVPLDDLIAAVWGDWFGPRGHVSVHVHHLRRKLGACGGFIVTRRGVGYMLAAGSEGVAHPLPPGWGLASLFDVLQVDGDARGVIWMLSNADRTVGWVSDSVTTLTGWTPQELMGRLPWDFSVGSDDQSVRDAIDEGASGPFETPRPVGLRCADGSSIWITASSRIFRDAEGAYLGGLTECRPVDLGAPPAPFTLYFDAESTLLAVEPHAPFLGWDPEAIIGSHFSLAGLDPSATRITLDSLVASGQVEHRVALPAMRAAGGTIPATATLRLEIDGGRVVGYSGGVTLD